MISIYTDGSSASSGGKPGGWAFVIVETYPDGTENILTAGYGGDPSTTNNKMELTAAIKGLEALAYQWYIGKVDYPAAGRKAKDVELVADSQYTLGMASGRMSPGMGKDGRPTNGDLVARLQKLAKQWLGADPDGKPRTRWVPGHAGDTWNERCDRLAKKGKKEVTDGNRDRAQVSC